ncbi:MAG: hypothetical protein KC910_09315 [Candidatus Eremiobacteraeota bacterium]|nr:hypothetical protein [Candidatus Eremiobacteraeota bacterium]
MSQDTNQLEQEALDYLVGLAPAEKCLVILTDGPDVEVKGAGFETDQGLSERVARLVHLASTGRPMLESSGRGESTISWALAPIVHQEKTLGALYVQCSVSAGAFQHSHLRQLNAYAKELAPKLASATRQTVSSSPAPPSEEPPGRDSKGSLVFGVALLALSLVWMITGFIANPSAKPAATPTPSQAERKPLEFVDPVTAARFFLVLVERQQYDSAYTLLSPRLKASMSPTDFESRLKGWQNEGDALRQITLGNRQNDSCTVLFKGQSTDWTWRLVLVDPHGWKLDGFQGGPPLEP